MGKSIGPFQHFVNVICSLYYAGKREKNERLHNSSYRRLPCLETWPDWRISHNKVKFLDSIPSPQVKMTIFVTFRIYEILLTMRTLLIVIIAVHSLVDKIKSVLQIPQAERNPENSSNNSESENDSSLEVPRKYIVPNESIIGAKIIFISSFAMSIAIVISQFVNNIDPTTMKKTDYIRAILLIDDYFAPLWQSCNLALFLFLGNDNIGKYIKQCFTYSWFLSFIILMYIKIKIFKYTMYPRYHSRFFDPLAHSNLRATLATDQKWPLSCLRITYQSLAECHLL